MRVIRRFVAIFSIPPFPKRYTGVHCRACTFHTVSFFLDDSIRRRFSSFSSYSRVLGPTVYVLLLYHTFVDDQMAALIPINLVNHIRRVCTRKFEVFPTTLLVEPFIVSSSIPSMFLERRTLCLMIHRHARASNSQSQNDERFLLLIFLI